MIAVAPPRPKTIRQALAWRLDIVLFKMHFALAMAHMRAAERHKERCPWFRWAEASFPEIPDD